MSKVFKIILAIVILLLVIIVSIVLYNDYRIKHAKIEVKTIDDLNIEVYSEIKLSDLIDKINGKLIKNKIIKTNKLGPKEIAFDYINDDNIKVSYTFNINIVDTTPPVISETNQITLNKNYSGDISNKFFCADNYDKDPQCEIVGDYNLNEVGEYNAIYQATDSSNNVSTHDLLIKVVDAQNTVVTEKTVTNYSDIYKKFKSDTTKIGIDVSYHQGEIDYQKLKDNNVEFAILRVGYGYDKEGKNVLDKKFIDNIKGFNKVKIPVGIYFYSYAENNKEALEQAKWVLKQIKKYNIELSIIFDWENWSTYKEYNLSLHDLNDLAKTFNKKIKDAGYKPMIYSSKNYLEYAWEENKYSVWIAHYSESRDYEGLYKMWQMCDDGKIDGVDGPIDIDIMYE